MIKLNIIIRTFFIATFLFFAVLNINSAFAVGLNLSSESATFEPSKLKSLGVFDVDKGVPDSPAFAVLNLTPSKILTPNSPREFVTSILNSQDENGNFQQGIAIDTSFLNLYGRKVTLDKYRYKSKSFIKHPNAIFYRTRLSLAVVKGQEDADKSTKLSLGLHFLPIDSGDVRLNENIDQCYKDGNEKIKKHFPDKGPAEFKTEKEFELHLENVALKRQAELRNSLKGKTTVSGFSIKRCVGEELKDKEINRWAIGIAPKLISPDGETDNFEYDGLGVWTSYAFGMDRISEKLLGEGNALRSDGSTQLIVHARYLFDESNPVPGMPKTFLEQDSFLVGGKLQTAGDSWNAALEFSYSITNPDVGKTDQSFLYAFVFEKKILKSLWVNASVGSTDGRDLQADNVFGKVNLKWAFTEIQKALFLGNDK